MLGNGIASASRGPAARQLHLNGAAILDRHHDHLQSASLPRFLRKPAPERADDSGSTRLWRVVALVLLPFVAGYYLSYLYRSINALISEALMSEFALSPANLGFLTSTYFLAFALIQLPLGVWQRPAVVSHLLVMAIALSASALLLGAGANRLRQHGISLAASLAVATGIALLAQLALVLRWPVPAWLPWVVIAGIGAGTVLSYAILSEMFPKSASGRVNGALNLLHVSAAFAVQYAIGLVVQQWPGEAGRYPPIAYQTAVGLNLTLQTAAFLWFVRPERYTVASHLSAHPFHALAAKLRVTPPAAVPYALARRAWRTRIVNARAQEWAWRSAALASFAVLTLLGLSLGITLLGSSVAAHVLQVTQVAERGEIWSAPPRRGQQVASFDQVEVPAPVPVAADALLSPSAITSLLERNNHEIRNGHRR